MQATSTHTHKSKHKPPNSTHAYAPLKSAERCANQCRVVFGSTKQLEGVCPLSFVTVGPLSPGAPRALADEAAVPAKSMEQTGL
eukprot:13082979-Alexandrium_andersonii.AAC.1